MLSYFSGGKTPDVGSRTYTEIMKEQYLRAEETEVYKTLISIIDIFCINKVIIICR